MNEQPHRYDYILMAILLSSSYAVSHLIELQPAYTGVWMILMAASVSLWLLYNGLHEAGKVIGTTLPPKTEDGKPQ
jgi:hypothetical protein